MPLKRKEGILMVKRKSIVVFLIFILLLATGGQTLASGYAETPQSRAVIPLFTNIDQISANLTFSGSQANCSAYVIGKVGTTRITGKAVLSRQNPNGTYTTLRT